MKLVACWHHGDIDRLYRHLAKNRIDLYGPLEITEKTHQSRLERFLKRMKLKGGDRIRIVVKGKIIAEATIDGPEGSPVHPLSLPVEDQKGPWKTAMPLRSIDQFDPPKPADCYRRYQSSHRLDCRKPCA